MERVGRACVYLQRLCGGNAGISPKTTETEGYKEPSFYPKKMFSGNITIDGKPWIELMRDGELSETETFKKVTYGKFRVFGELADWHHIENCLTEEDYTHISFNKKRRGV